MTRAEWTPTPGPSARGNLVDSSSPSASDAGSDTSAAVDATTDAGSDATAGAEAGTTTAFHWVYDGTNKLYAFNGATWATVNANTPPGNLGGLVETSPWPPRACLRAPS